jgi:hypothetical protein
VKDLEGIDVKTSLAVILLTAAAFAQNGSTPDSIAPGCGAANIKFSVTTDKSKHPVVQPEVGKALVYFIEDDTEFESTPKPTTRIGVDGTWVAANHGNSYSYFSVDPGEHHLCASWQGKTVLGAKKTSAAAHFKAETGKVYYFIVKNKWLREHGFTQVDLSPLDTDEGQLLATRFASSTSHPK